MLFIENRTNYEVYIQKEINPAELVVYHGGFHGITKQQFFKLIVSALPESVPVEHWGDIDLGGFKIFQQVRQNIALQLKPWRMDRQALLEHQDCATTFSSTYRKELEKALADPAFSDFADVLKTMLELGLRLEQEAMQ